MAKKNAPSAPAPKTSAPSRFNKKVGREDGDGWAKKEEGNTIQGKLLGRFEFKDSKGKPRAFYQILLQESCDATTKNEDDPEGEYQDIRLEAGQIVNVDEVAKLMDLAPLATNGGEYDVWFKFKGKVKRKGSQNTPWNFDGPFVDTVKAPPKDDTPF